MARTFTFRQVGLFGTAVLALGFAYGVRSSRPDASSPAGERAGETEHSMAPTEADDGSNEGITVHGHWKIEVRDPDGTVAEIREFENALMSGGALSLARVLGRVAIVNNWRVVLRDSGADSPCLDGGQPSLCVIWEASGTDSEFQFYNLTSTVPPIGDPDENLLILSGTATAARDGQILIVSTELTTPCGSGVAPECGVTRTMTQTTLGSPVVVQAGQSILATVQISFS